MIPGFNMGGLGGMGGMRGNQPPAERTPKPDTS